jgi:EGF-like domain
MGIAWVQVATGVDDAHGMVECSNMGICDQNTGACKCREGFEGNACERLACPSLCQGGRHSRYVLAH